MRTLSLFLLTLFLIAGCGKSPPRHGAHTYYYANGDVRSILNYEKGRLHGTAYYYFKGEIPKAIIQYKSGLQHGENQWFYNNGKILAEATYDQGNVVGTIKRYRRDGALFKEFEKLAEIPDGYIQRTFYPNGALESSRRVVLGKYHGRSVRYYENGAIQNELYYVDNKRSGVVREFYSNGSPKEEYFTYHNGVLDGYHYRYYPNYVIASIHTYQNNNQEGPSWAFYPSGALARESDFKNDRMVGRRRFYDRNENLKVEQSFFRGIMHSQTIWLTKGVPLVDIGPLSIVHFLKGITGRLSQTMKPFFHQIEDKHAAVTSA